MNRSWLRAALGFGYLFASPGQARACKLPILTPHAVDASMQASDHVAPTLRAPLPFELTLGKLSKDDGLCSPPPDSTCDDIAMLELTAGATDDATPRARIGYRLSLDAGTLPAGLTLPADAVEPGANDTLALTWVDATKEPVDFTLRVLAIDLAGNESAPQTVHVTGDQAVACAIAEPRASGRVLAWIAIVALLLAARRPRRR